MPPRLDHNSCANLIDLMCKKMGSVFFYVDPIVSQQPRWYILVGVQEDVFYLVNPQSNVEGRLKARNETRESLRSLVVLTGEEDYSELNKESVIDCNTVNPVAKAILLDKCKNEVFNMRPQCPQSVYERILRGISLSGEISGHKMKAIRKSNLTFFI